MKKMLIGLLICVILLVLCLNWLINSFNSEIKKERDKYETNIGQKVIIENDTLTIMNYSTIMKTFTLSNGKTVDASFIFNNKNGLSNSR